MPNLIKVFRTLPKQLFRVNNGHDVKLRPWSPHRHAFDIHVCDSRVQAKALHPETYQAPNGASLRPNSPYQQLLVKKLFRGNDVIIYTIPKGTLLPDSLLLVHERSDHYSLQPARDMLLDELNEEVTNFMLSHALVFSKSQWLAAYPTATDFDGTPR